MNPQKPKALAASLDVSSADLPALGAAFIAGMKRLGMDGAPIFRKLIEGKSLAAALQAPPGVVALLYARAHNYFLIGRHDKAALLFRALCALADDKADHWAGLGVCQKVLGRAAEAEASFRMASERRPDWALPYFHLTELALKQKDWPRADSMLREFEARAAPSTERELLDEAQRFRTAIDIQTQAKTPAGAVG